MPVGLGHKTFIGLGEETVYGTPVSRTTFLEIVTGGDGLNVTEERIETQSVKEIGIRGDIDLQQGMVSVEGPLTLETPYDGAELLFKHAFGSVASSQPDPAGDPTVWQHVFDIADALLTGLTIEVQRDITAFLAEGSKINTLEFALGGPDELLRVTAEILGEDVSTVAASVPTLPAVGKFHAPEAVLSWNAAQLNVSEFSIKLDNKLDADRRFIGSRFRSEPTRSAKIEITGSFTAEFEDTTLYDDFRNAANRALQVKFTGPGIGAAARAYELTLDCPVSRITEYPVNVDSEGRITVEVAFKAYRDATDKELKLTLQNLTAGPI